MTPDVLDPGFDSANPNIADMNLKFLRKSIPLMKYMPIVKEEDTVNLMQETLSDIPAPKKAENATEDKHVPHWKTEIYLNLIFDETKYKYKFGMPSEVSSNIVVDWDTITYDPIVYVSDFWLLKKHMVPLNTTVIGSELNLTLNFQMLDSHWFQVQ